MERQAPMDGVIYYDSIIKDLRAGKIKAGEVAPDVNPDKKTRWKVDWAMPNGIKNTSVVWASDEAKAKKIFEDDLQEKIADRNKRIEEAEANGQEFFGPIDLTGSKLISIKPQKVRGPRYEVVRIYPRSDSYDYGYAIENKESGMKLRLAEHDIVLLFKRPSSAKEFISFIEKENSSAIEGVSMKRGIKKKSSTEATMVERLKALGSGQASESQGVDGVGEFKPLVANRAVESNSSTLAQKVDSVLSKPEFKKALKESIKRISGTLDMDGFDDEEDITVALTEAIQEALEKFGINIDDWDGLDSQEAKVWEMANRIFTRSSVPGFEAMSDTEIESLQSILASSLEKLGSVQVIENLIDSGVELSSDFLDQVTFIKNTSDLSDTNQVLNDLLSAAETLLDDIQIELLVDDLEGKGEEELYSEDGQDGDFEDYEEPEDWSQLDQPEESSEETDLGEENEE